MKEPLLCILRAEVSKNTGKIVTVSSKKNEITRLPVKQIKVQAQSVQDDSGYMSGING